MRDRIKRLREKLEEDREQRRQAQLKKLSKQREKDLLAADRAAELAKVREQVREAARKRVAAQERLKRASSGGRFSGVVKQGRKFLWGKPKKKATKRKKRK